MVKVLFYPNKISHKIAVGLLEYRQLYLDCKYRCMFRRKLPLGSATSATKVSVVVTVHNKRLYTQRCLRSVLDQTHTNFELVIVQNGSSDGSDIIVNKFLKTARLRRLQAEGRLKYYSTKKKLGSSGAKNKGLGMATGEYVLVLDSDNCLHPQFLSLCANALDCDPNLGIVHTDFAYIDQQSTVRNIAMLGPYQEMLFARGVNLMENNSMFRRKFFSKMGCRFRSGESLVLPHMDDYALWFSILNCGGVPRYLPLVLFGYTIDGTNLSGDISCQFRVNWIKRLRICCSDYLLKQHTRQMIGRRLSWQTFSRS